MITTSPRKHYSEDHKATEKDDDQEILRKKSVKRNVVVGQQVSGTAEGKWM